LQQVIGVTVIIIGIIASDWVKFELWGWLIFQSKG
jgi:hypothetical protein